MVDDALLALVDAEATRRGQTRRVFIERALKQELGGNPAAPARPSAPGTVAKGRQPKATHAKPAGPVPVARQALDDGVSAARRARQHKLNEAKGRKR